MPTEAYVEEKFDDGIAFEKWLESFFRQLQDVKVAKRTDAAEKPHKYEDIKDIPSEPDMEIWLNESRKIQVWVTHKKMNKSKWEKNKNKYLAEMFWRYKTYKFMQEGQYLAYGIFEGNADIIGGEPPYEVLFMPFSKDIYRGTWRSYSLKNQDDLRAKLDMTEAYVIYKDGVSLVTALSSLLH